MPILCSNPTSLYCILRLWIFNTVSWKINKKRTRMYIQLNGVKLGQAVIVQKLNMVFSFIFHTFWKTFQKTPGFIYQSASFLPLLNFSLIMVETSLCDRNSKHSNWTYLLIKKELNNLRSMNNVSQIIRIHFFFIIVFWWWWGGGGCI